MQWKFILTLLVILVFVFFTGQNWQFVTLKFLTVQFETTLAFIIVFSLLVGFIIGTIIAGIKQLKTRKEIKKLKDKINKQNEELKSLRYFQIKDDE